jgi:hypothetical protein
MKRAILSRVGQRLVALSAAWGLTACGGGIWIGIGGDDDERPSVSLVANVEAAAPGQPVQLSAAAADDYGVDFVAFYRVTDDGNSVLMGRDDAAPWQWNTVMPPTGGTRVRFYARAQDGGGQRTDSDFVEVAVLR